MGLPTRSIQAALLTRYLADASLLALLNGAAIYDKGSIPTNTIFPYLILFPESEEAGTLKTFGKDAMDTIIHLSIFTQNPTLSEARLIAERLYDLTQDKPLALDNGFVNVSIQFRGKMETVDFIDTPGGLPTQVVEMQFLVRTQG